MKLEANIEQLRKQLKTKEHLLDVVTKRLERSDAELKMMFGVLRTPRLYLKFKDYESRMKNA